MNHLSVICSLSLNTEDRELSLRLLWLHQAQFAGFYTAKELGYFDDEGLSVEIEQGGPDFNSITMVSSGNDFAGITSADQVIIARDAGIPIKAVSVIFKESQVCFMVKKGSGIDGPKDFAGKVVGMKYGYNTETEYISILNQTGVDRSQLKETAVKFDMQRFFVDDVDVWPSYIINEPLAAEEAGFDVECIRPKDYGINGYGDTLFVTEESIKNNPEAVRGICKAVKRGWQTAIENEKLAIDHVLKYKLDADRGHESKMLEISKGLILGGGTKEEIGSVGELSVWSSMIEELHRQSQIKPGILAEDVVSDICQSI